MKTIKKESFLKGDNHDFYECCNKQDIAVFRDKISNLLELKNLQCIFFLILLLSMSACDNEKPSRPPKPIKPRFNTIKKTENKQLTSSLLSHGEKFLSEYDNHSVYLVLKRLSQEKNKSPQTIFRIANLYNSVYLYKKSEVLLYDLHKEKKPNKNALAYIISNRFDEQNEGIYMESKDPIKDLLKIVDANMQDPFHPWALGMIELKKKNYVDALMFFDRALDLEKNFLWAIKYKAFALHQEKQFQQALVYFNKAIALNANNNKFFFYRSITLMELNQFELALKDIEKSLRINPFDELSLYQKVKVLKSLGRSKQALEVLEKISRIWSFKMVTWEEEGKKTLQNPRESEYKFLKGEILMDMKNYSKANYHFRQLLKKHPNNFSYLFYRGQSYYKKGDYYMAYQDFERCLKVQNKNIELLRIMAKLTVKIKYYDQSISLYKKIISLYEDNGMISEAITVVEELLRFYPQYDYAQKEKKRLEYLRK